MDDDREAAAARKGRLRAHLLEVARERDPDRAPAGHAYVADYIRRSFAAHGVPATHAFRYRGRTHANIILDLPGRDAGGFILVGAHYDGVPGSPGADDNGSALAVLLDLAREFAQAPRTDRCGWRRSTWRNAISSAAAPTPPICIAAASRSA